MVMFWNQYVSAMTETKWATPCEDVFFFSAYADSKGPDQPVHPLTLLLDTVEWTNGKQMSGREFAHARDESESVHFAHIRRHLLLGSAHMISVTHHVADSHMADAPSFMLEK